MHAAQQQRCLQAYEHICDACSATAAMPAGLRTGDALLPLRCLAGNLQSIYVMHAAQQQRCPQAYEQGMHSCRCGAWPAIC